MKLISHLLRRRAAPWLLAGVFIYQGNTTVQSIIDILGILATLIVKEFVSCLHPCVLAQIELRIISCPRL